MKKILLFLAAFMMSAAIYAKGEVKKVVFTTNPVMHCDGCENKIKNHMKFEKGIKKIETNIERQEVVITYDAEKTTPEKLVKAFSKIGYKVKVVKAPAAVQKGK